MYSNGVPQWASTTRFRECDIAQRAYDIYVKSGYQQGRCTENWQQAERDLRDLGTALCQAEHRIQDVFAPDSDRDQL